MPTILVTGCSSGFGQEIARLFLGRGWSVVATMRSPREGLLPQSDKVRILPLDVTDGAGIAAAVEAAGPLDALVNNAGLGALMPLEGLTMAQARELFEINVLGLIATTMAVVPGMRARGSGVIVNIGSSVTLRPLRLLSVYTATKAAVNGFTESLALELAPFGIRARVVLPGAAPTTAFGANARARMGGDMPAAYADQAADVFAAFQDRIDFTQAQDVAEAVWRAVTDRSCPMRLPAGADAVRWADESRSADAGAFA